MILVSARIGRILLGRILHSFTTKDTKAHEGVVNALDLIIDIFNDPLQRCRQRLTPARPLQLPHSFR
jgi:hypothetical protein